MRLLASRSPRVSLVSPVYGVAPYLPRFLDSLSAQDHPHDRLQVVLVLDGACDDSPSICRTWAAATDIDALVIETGNGGQGRARNLALARADGSWIGFPDPDDWIAPDFLTRLLSSRTRGDVLLAGRTIIHQDGRETTHPLDFRFQDGTVRVDAALMRDLVLTLDTHQILRSPWGHLSAAARARMILWHGAPEVAIVRDGAVTELYTADARSREAKPAEYAGALVGYHVTGREAERLYPGGDTPRVPIWPRRPRLTP